MSKMIEVTLDMDPVCSHIQLRETRAMGQVLLITVEKLPMPDQVVILPIGLNNTSLKVQIDEVTWGEEYPTVWCTLQCDLCRRHLKATDRYINEDRV